MAPIIPSTSNPSTESRTVKSSDIGGGDDLIVNVRYTNTLPDIPFDTKFLQYPFDPNRFIHYQPTSLEKNYKYEVLAEFDLGVPIDLINPDTYAGKGGDLAPEDEALLEEEVLIPKNTKRSQHHGQSVSWLRRTEYISTEQTRFQPTHMEKVEAKVGFSIKKNFKDEKLYMDISSQIKAIEKTFEDVKVPVTEHYSKPNVYAVEELPILPDFKCWKYPCAQVIFDSDPAPVGRPVPAQIEEMSQAMIRGVMDESGEQFVAYFLPTAETLEKRRQDVVENRPYDDDAVYEYSMAREYNWNVKSKSSIGYEENYFLVVRDSGVYYNELETRVRLSKRRQIAGQNSLTKLVVRHRPLDEQEFNMLKVREKAIEEVVEEEEEEEEEDDDDDEEEEEEQTKKEDEEDKQNKNRGEEEEEEEEKDDTEEEEKDDTEEEEKDDTEEEEKDDTEEEEEDDTEEDEEEEEEEEDGEQRKREDVII